MGIILMIYVFVLGVVIGSFLNVVIYRVPLQISIVKGRSFCPTCSHKLTALDLVPVFSFVFLRGKCRHCGAKIGAIYPAVELLTGILFLLIYLRFGISWETPLYMLICACLISLAFIDLHHGIIPDRFPLIIAACALVLAFLPPAMWWDRLIGLVAVSVPMAVIVLLSDSMGWGDVKLFAACGFLLGWKGALLTLLFSSVAAAVYALTLMARHKASGKTAIPYGPFIAAGAMASALYGNDILSAYLSMF